MKRLILGSLSILLMSTTVTPTLRAELITDALRGNQSQLQQTNVPPRIAARMEVTPFNLVFLAFQGFFETQGIPSSMGLVSAYQNKQVSAIDLVKIAVSMNRLPQKTLTDQKYINAVDSQLEALMDNN